MSKILGELISEIQNETKTLEEQQESVKREREVLLSMIESLKKTLKDMSDVFNLMYEKVDDKKDFDWGSLVDDLKKNAHFHNKQLQVFHEKFISEFESKVLGFSKKDSAARKSEIDDLAKSFSVEFKKVRESALTTMPLEPATTNIQYNAMEKPAEIIEDYGTFKITRVISYNRSGKITNIQTTQS